MSKHLKRRLLIVSLDGLSTEEFQLLTLFCSGLQELAASGKLLTMETGLLAAAQPIWSELLTGRPWHELGCPGYARPGASLNDLEIVSEDKLAQKMSLLGSDDSNVDLIINIPLVLPGKGRIWLSDGSLPLQLTVSPQDLAGKSPYNSYKARAYPASVSALSDRMSSVREVLSVESKRLDCALELIEKQNWKTCILRLSIFDLLAHLFGTGYLSAETLAVRADIDSFFNKLDQAIQKISNLSPETALCLFSAFSHEVCTARISLNELLIRGGFCETEPLGDELKSENLERRQQAALQIAAAGKRDVKAADRLISGALRFKLGKTIACSPISSAVYLNRTDCFRDGIVEPEDAEAKVDEVLDFLKRELGKELGDDLTFWRGDCANFNAPDLMIHAPGVEFHDSEERVIVDRHSTPRSVHKAEGFVWLKETMSGLNGRITPVELHSLLKERAL